MPRRGKQNHIVRLIYARNKSILQLAHELGCNYATLYRKLHGQRRWKSGELERLAAALDLPVFALSERSNPERNAALLRELGLNPDQYLASASLLSSS